MHVPPCEIIEKFLNPCSNKKSAKSSYFGTNPKSSPDY